MRMTLRGPRRAPIPVDDPSSQEPHVAGRTGPDVPTGLMAPTEPLAILSLRRVGQADLAVFPLSLGTGSFGWKIHDDTSTAILDRYCGLGGNFFDASDSEVAGRSELLIGSWLRRQTRDRVIVATRIGRNSDNRGLDRAAITGAVEGSLRRLGTDYIDMVYFDGDDPTTHLEESLSAIDGLMRKGYVRFVGACDYAPSRLTEARVLAANGLPRFSALRTGYSLVNRARFEGDLSLVAKAQTLGVVAHGALAGGFLGGEYHSRTGSANETRDQGVQASVKRRASRVLATLAHIGREHGVRGATVALAWLLSKPTIVAPVVRVSAPDQVSDLMKAASVRLSRGQVRELDRLVQFGPKPSRRDLR